MSQPLDDDRTVAAEGAHRGAGCAHSENALPIGTRLHEFEIIDLVGEGGFGIVYLARDCVLERKVALKEYLPSALASRGPGMTVAPTSSGSSETFQIGLRSFINEGRMLAQFDHPALVKVYRFWEANGTAYMVMPYYQGITLKRHCRAQKRLRMSFASSSFSRSCSTRWRCSIARTRCIETSRPTTS